MTASAGGEGNEKGKETARPRSPMEDAKPGPVSTDQVILATAGYDHTIKFWAAHTGVCTRTLQHPDSQVNSLAISGDGSMIAAGGYQHIRMFDLTSGELNPVIDYINFSKNVTQVGFQVKYSVKICISERILCPHRKTEGGCTQGERIVQLKFGI